MALIACGILGAVGFVIISVLDALITDEFDPVVEERCKKCISYTGCSFHGCDYNCKYYMTEEILRRKGLQNESEKR